MKNNKLNITIYILTGIVIGLLVAFVVVLLLRGNDNKSNDKKEVNTETVEYSDPVEYFESVEKTNDENKLKKGFTNVVDFLFYGKEINGKTLSELTDSAKLKIMKIALSLDSKIDDRFPGYKNKISDKYKEIKSKVVELYVDTTTKICDNHEQLCIDAKNDFNSLKDSFGLTFDYIKKYGSKGLDKIKEWYENFRD
jgi:flagellar basal body-associated protein FliL